MWQSSPNGWLQQGHFPFWSLKSFADNPLDNFPPLASFLARRFWSIMRRASGLALCHAKELALDFSGLAFSHAKELAFALSGLAAYHATLASLRRSELAA
jgi:hypothetical protein